MKNSNTATFNENAFANDIMAFLFAAVSAVLTAKIESVDCLTKDECLKEAYSNCLRK